MCDVEDIPTWIAGGSLVVTVWLAWLTKVAADAAKESATTAKETLIATKRPWVVISDPEITGFDPLVELFTDQPPAGPLQLPPNHFHLKCILKNCGEGPAWIDEISWRFVLHEEPNRLPDKPDYAGSMSIPGWIITPHEEKPFTGINLDLTLGVFTKDSLRSLQSNNILPMFFGFIKYRDQWQGEHETRFCWIFIEPLKNEGKKCFILGGNNNWNKQT